MNYLVDSDWVADWLKGRAAAVQLLTALRPASLSVSAVTYGEIYEGIYYGYDPKNQERGFQAFLRVTPVLPVTRLVLRRFARIRGDLRAHGQLIGDMDLLIAATALEYNLVLVTRNRTHFARIPGLILRSS